MVGVVAAGVVVEVDADADEGAVNADVRRYGSAAAATAAGAGALCGVVL